MPHRNAADRADWLRRLAEMLPGQIDENNLQPLATRQTVDTLNEIAAYLESLASDLVDLRSMTDLPTEPPADYTDVTIRVSGPQLWFLHREGTPPFVTLRRLDYVAPGAPEVPADERERTLIAALVNLVHNRLNAAEYAG